MSAPIDLRSDTVTKPSAAMRAAMAAAPVGDDVYGEDPTLIQLERQVADLLGKEAALFVPSGTMANQIALSLHTRPGDEVIVPEGAHCMVYETGAAAALAGVQFSTVGDDSGLFTAAELATRLHPENLQAPRTTLLVIENTHNRGGGRIFPQPEIAAIATLARAHGLAMHLDGARLWNAHVATGVSLAKLAAPFDSVSICLSKGLGAPVGSLLVASSALVTAGRRRRKMLGGGMRQAGILAAAGLYAIAHNVTRLGQDHEHARRVAHRLGETKGIGMKLELVQTNILVWDLPYKRDAQTFVAQAKERGVLINAHGKHRVRAVTHLDVSAEDCDAAATILVDLMRGT